MSSKTNKSKRRQTTSKICIYVYVNAIRMALCCADELIGVVYAGYNFAECLS